MASHRWQTLVGVVSAVSIEAAPTQNEFHPRLYTLLTYYTLK